MFHFSRNSIDVFGLSIHYYGILIALGVLLGVLLAARRQKRLNLPPETGLDLALICLPVAVVCARAYYVIFSWQDYAANPISVLYIWEGGLAIYGGVLGAVVGVAVFCRVKKIRFTTVIDLVLLGFLIGQSMGRWGNFFNREAFGAATDSFFRMGLYNTVTNAWEYYHPTFLYESVWNLTGLAILHFLSKKRKYDGQVALGYAFWYGLGRTMIEGLRVDSLYWGPFRVSQMLAVLSCVTAAAVLIWQSFRPQDPAKLYVNQMAAAARESGKPEETGK